MNDTNSLTSKATLARAQAFFETFQARIKDAPYEIKGVLFSEALFVAAAARHLAPANVFESGRARGVSTYLLSKCFPETRIVSVEFNEQSADVPIAARNLAGMDRVECLFGDSQEILMKMVRRGDLVVIDGPKGFRALRLALQLLRRREPAAVFIHDCFRGSCERAFLDLHMPEAFFSDHEDFVKPFRELDEKCWELRGKLDMEEFQIPYEAYGKPSSYGPTFACLPWRPRGNYTRRLIQVRWAGFKHRLRRSLDKRTAHSPGV